MTNVKQILSILFLFGSLVSVAQQDSLGFGSRKKINNGFTGKIYFLPAGTDSLPHFDTMHLKGTIYAKKLDLPGQNWQAGFPGVTDRFEWFAIEYKSRFKLKNPGHYKFTLVSDDGSRLFIDDKLVIDHDGIHGAQPKSGEIDLDGAAHNMTVQYFQGPRYYVALQLFYSLNGSEDKIVGTTDDLVLTTPEVAKSKTVWWIMAAALILIIILFIWIRRKKEHNQPKT